MSTIRAKIGRLTVGGSTGIPDALVTKFYDSLAPGGRDFRRMAIIEIVGSARTDRRGEKKDAEVLLEISALEAADPGKVEDVLREIMRAIYLQREPHQVGLGENVSDLEPTVDEVLEASRAKLSGEEQCATPRCILPDGHDGDHRLQSYADNGDVDDD